MNLYQWALKHHVSMTAVAELQQIFGMNGQAVEPTEAAKSEAAVTNEIRLEAAKKGVYLWRNNVGAAYMKDGSFLRYGLANESKKMNDVMKSSDLIGVRPRLITEDLVGLVIGQFICREVKRSDWRYGGDAHEVAQLNFIKLVTACGGDAAFATGPGSL